MSEETATQWAVEAGKHLVTFGGAATGLFGIAGWVLWNAKASCTPETAQYGAACVKRLTVTGQPMTPGQLSGWIALAVLIVCGIYLVVLDIQKRRPTGPPSSGVGGQPGRQP